MFAKGHARTVAWVFAVLTLVGCASHRYTVVEAPTESLSDYKILQIKEFTTSLNEPEAKRLSLLFADRLMEEIAAHRKAHPDDVVYGKVVRQTDEAQDVLVMEASVISYEEGSRAKRYFLGFGAGKAYCTIQARFINKETGEEVARTNFDGELSGGLFGGDADETVDGVVKAFLDYMKQYMAEA